MNHQAIAVRVMVGASHAYACISEPGRSLDVRLEPGRSAAASLAEIAHEERAKAAKLLQRADILERAARALIADDAPARPEAIRGRSVDGRSRVTVGGVEFELVRTRGPGGLYWRVRTIENDFLFEGGCFPDNRSRPRLLASLEDCFRRAKTEEEFRRRLDLPTI